MSISRSLVSDPLESVFDREVSLITGNAREGSLG